MVIYRSISRKIFEAANYLFFTLFAISILIPFINAIALSLSERDAVSKGLVSLMPVGLNTSSYELILTNMYFISSFANTVMLTVVNTCLVILIALSAAYALASKYFKGVRIAFFYLLVPMYFGGGLIPTYLLINGIGLHDSYLALILPSITSIFLIIIFKNTIQQLPAEMRESAEIDGAGEVTILFRIILPLIIPMVTAFVIFSAVGYWNEWFNCMLYIENPYKFTLQYKLREILTINDLANDPIKNANARAVSLRESIHPQNLRMAALLVTILPIMIIYPFLQKYFIHGVIVGAVKG